MSNFNLSNDFSHCSDEKYYIYGSGTIDDREKSAQYISSFPDRTFSIVEMVDGYFAKVLTCINNLNFGKLTYYYWARMNTGLEQPARSRYSSIRKASGSSEKDLALRGLFSISRQTGAREVHLCRTPQATRPYHTGSMPPVQHLCSPADPICLGGWRKSFSSEGIRHR